MVLLSRFLVDQQIRYGVVEGDQICSLEEDFLSGIRLTGERFDLEEVFLLSPCRPSKIVCVGLNYLDHARELNLSLPEEPILFLKPPSSVIGPKQPIIYPSVSQQVDYEAELAVVIGKTTRRVSATEARSKILGYTCGNDVTARDLQRKDGQWTRAKSFDTFCPLGPWIRTDLDPENLELRMLVNEEVKQNSNTNQMVFGVDYLISFISQTMTLFPGDVVLTGTPVGVGAVKSGDNLTVEIKGLGQLTNWVKSEEI